MWSGSGTICVWVGGVFDAEKYGKIDLPFPWEQCSTRLQNCFARCNREFVTPRTIGEMLKFGKTEAAYLRNMGKRTLAELRTVMEDHGISEQWDNT